MDKEKERRVEESKSSKIGMSDEKAAVLEEMSRKVNNVAIEWPGGKAYNYYYNDPMGHKL